MLAFNPFHPAVQNNRGVALAPQGRYEEALASYNGALAINPDCAEALSNRGDALRMLGHYAEALSGYTRAQALKPGLAYAHWNEGICRLQMGDYPAGWKKYEWRLKIKALNLKARKLRQPRWLGAGSLHGRTILLHAEQGLGDTIQFARYAPLVAAKGASVLLDVPKMLAPLMATLAGVKRVLVRSEPLPQLVHPGADFRNTAEAISALDLVISVDTAWAHWAGAAGKPLWVLLPFVSHWTWLTGREDSPWYPTARLFRQPRIGDWTSVIRSARDALAGGRHTA